MKISRPLRIVAPPSSEPDVLERLGGVPVETCRLVVVPSATREITACNPRSGPVAQRRHLLEHGVCGQEALLGLVQAAPLQQGPAEHELRLADLVEEVLAAVE